MRTKVGLALGGGAARGLAHIGVLQVLQKEEIPIDMIAGTSAGAAIGAIYAQGKDASTIEKIVMDLDWRRLASLVDLALPRTGFIEGKKITALLRKIIGDDIKFDALKIPLACIATDIVTGEEVIIEEGSVLEAVRASISVPVIFTVAKWKGRYLVDGGLVNPVPVSVLKSMGADFIIAVNVIPDRAYQDKNGAKELKKLSIFGVIMQSMYIGSYSLVKHCLEGADIVVQPKVGHIGVGEFRRAQELILQGKLAAQESIPEIRGLLAG
jgi:NTE family protein